MDFMESRLHRFMISPVRFSVYYSVFIIFPYLFIWVCNFCVVRATPGQKSQATASVMYDYLTKVWTFFSLGMQFSYFPYPGYSHRQLGNKTEMYHMYEGDHSAADCARACNRRTDCEGYVHHSAINRFFETFNRGFSKLSNWHFPIV